MKPLILSVTPSLVLPAVLLALFAGNDLPAQTPLNPAADGIGLITTITGSVTGDTKLTSGNARYGAVSSRDFGTAISQNITVAPGSELGVGLSYSRTAFELPKGNGAAPLPERVQSLAVDLSYSQQFSETWSGLLAATPGYHSAGSGFSSKGFGVSVVALGIYQFNPALSIAAGFGYDSLATGRNKFGPGVGLDWKASKTWTFSFGYPKTGITYLFSETLSLSLLAEGNFGTYHVEKDPLPAAAGKPRLNDTQLEYYDTRLGLSANWKVSKQLVLSTSLGRVVDRSFDYHQRKFKIKSDEGTGYASLSLAWVF